MKGITYYEISVLRMFYNQTIQETSFPVDVK